MIRIQKYIRKLQVMNNSRKLKFELVLRNKIPTIKISKKHEKKVKNIIRLITIIGILSSLISFDKWYYSFTMAIGIFVLGQIFEKIIFTYKVMFVQPYPEKWNGTKWTTMVIGEEKNKPLLCFGFNDHIVADNFYKTIMSWNNNKLVNVNNIIISLIIDNKDKYSVYVYPSTERLFVTNGIKTMQEKLKYDNYEKEQISLIGQMICCKSFPNGPNSVLDMLKKNNSDIYVNICNTSDCNLSDPSYIESISFWDNKSILFRNIKIKRREELNKESDMIEYYHIF